jgi:hypothetical protein
MGRRLHLHLGDRGWVYGGRDRPILAPGDRPVDERQLDRSIGRRRPADGSRTPCYFTPIKPTVTTAFLFRDMQ